MPQITSLSGPPSIYSPAAPAGQGVEALYTTIVDVTLQQPYIGELIPESWLKTGRLIVGKRGSKNLLDWDTVQQQVPTLVLV